jgi:hypothetical protein
MATYYLPTTHPSTYLLPTYYLWMEGYVCSGMVCPTYHLTLMERYPYSVLTEWDVWMVRYALPTTYP